LGPFDDLEDFAGSFNINLVEAVFDVAEPFHDLDVLTTGIFVHAHISLLL